MLVYSVLFAVLALAEGGKVCYNDLGCFSTKYPWTSVVRPFPAPESPEKVNTRMYCYTRDSVETKYNVTLRPQISLGGCPFTPGRPTVFLTHGFFNTGSSSWLNELKNAYLFATDANVFIVDWGKEAVMLNYFQASSSTRVVAAEILRLIKFLQIRYGLEASSLHLIGHSLGAQIMGYVGKGLPETRRITGLDAAQPAFEAADKLVRLDKSDASFVELIHTNGLPLLGFGYVAPHGHVDFYVNGGQRQPLCEVSDLKTGITKFNDLKNFAINSAQSTFACSHNRAYMYFIDSLRPNCTLWGRKTTYTTRLLEYTTAGIYDSLVPNNTKCDMDSCIPMGLETPNFKARGTFIVNTPKVAPFCEVPKVNERINLEMSSSFKSINNNLATETNGNSKNVANTVTNTLKSAVTGLGGMLF